jgi:hypothetical protein
MHLLHLLPADQARRLAPDHHKREELRSSESDVDLSPVVFSRPDVPPVLHALLDAAAIEGLGPTRTVPPGPTKVDILTARFSVPGQPESSWSACSASC